MLNLINGYRENISKNYYKCYIYIKNIKHAKNNVSVLKKFTKKSQKYLTKINIYNYICIYISMCTLFINFPYNM